MCQGTFRLSEKRETRLSGKDLEARTKEVLKAGNWEAFSAPRTEPQTPSGPWTEQLTAPAGEPNHVGVTEKPERSPCFSTSLQKTSATDF